MNCNTKITCPVCGRLLRLDGTTNGHGELIMSWHIREGWKRCEGSYRTPRASEYLKKRPGVR